MRLLRQPFLLFFCVAASLLSQTSAQSVVTTQPAFPTADAAVTLVFDLKLATDGCAKGLLGKQDDVYLWSGAGSTATGEAFQFQPTGQTNFSAPFAPGKMTPLGNDKWQITLVPRTYFNVPASTPIRRLGVLLKSGDGKAQTEDFFVTIYNGVLQVKFSDVSATTVLAKPSEKSLILPASPGSIGFKLTVSSRATIRLTDNGQPADNLANDFIVDSSLVTKFSASSQSGTQHVVVATARSGIATATDTLRYFVAPSPVVSALPAGLTDGINYNAVSGRATLVLYAPKKKFVYVLGEFNNWEINPAYLMSQTPDGSRYWLELSGLPTGETAFQYLVDGTIPVADPYAEKILDRNNDPFIPATTYPNLKAFPQKAQGNTVSVLQPGQSPFIFQTTGFTKPAVNTMVVYELLVRDFVQNRSYQTLTDSLAYLKRLGINTIELMPVTEFSGNDSWGYNPIAYFAPDKAYGTKDALKRFIDAAHKQGIAVVLDMVLNQADYEFPYVKMYWAGDRPSADNPYFNQQATHPFSVFFDFNHESPDTKAFVDRVCRFWLTEYKVDGFRFDLSKGFTQKNTGGDVGAWGAYDASRVAIWKRIYDQIRTIDPSAYVILEHFADNREEKELADYGMLLWGNHNGDFRGATRSAQGNFEGLSYTKRGFTQPRLIGYAESHDEERLVYDMRQNGQTQGSYSIKSLPTALDRAKLAAAFMLLVPGPKMIWQFGELGYDLSINTCSDGATVNDGCRTAAKPLRWEYYQDPQRRKLYTVYSDLTKLKTTNPLFASTDFTTDFGGVLKRLTLRGPSGTVYLIGNFDVNVKTVDLAMPSLGEWYNFFEQRIVRVSVPDVQITLEPGEFYLFTTTPVYASEPNLVPYMLKTAQTTITAVEPEAGDQLNISPNPADSRVVIDLDSRYRGVVEMDLRDANGRTVRTMQSRKATNQLRQSLDLQTLPSGIYFLRVQQGNQRRVLKVLKR